MVSGYIVRVTRMEGEGGRSDYFTSTVNFLAESTAVGSYIRVSVRVAAFNDAGYGPDSDTVEGWTPPTGVCNGGEAV